MLRCFEKNEWDEIPTANQTRQCQITNLQMFFPLNCQFIVDFRLPQYGPAIKGGHITCCLLPQGQFFFYFQSCHVSQSDVTSTDDQEGISVPAATGAFWHFKESSPQHPMASHGYVGLLESKPTSEQCSKPSVLPWNTGCKQIIGIPMSDDEHDPRYVG